MTHCDFYLKNNTPYEVTLLRADGSDWGQWLGYVAITANSDKFVKVEDMKCPRASGETDHWGWLMFKAYPPQFPTFAKYFYIFARQQSSGQCDTHHMAKTQSADSHDNLGVIGTTSYTPDKQNGGSPKIECTLSGKDLDFQIP